MATKIKGIYKSFKLISQIFVVKEREMEIGYPTDVKHVAHIGWESRPGSGPSWMNEYRTASNFSTSLGDHLGERGDANSMPITSWSTHDFDGSTRSEPTSNNISSSEHPHASKKNKRRKTKSPSSPRSSSSSTRRSRAAKPNVMFSEATPTRQV